MTLPDPERTGPPRIWALLGARAGDNSQVLALAEALGWPFQIKQLEYNRLRMLGPRPLGHSLLSLTRRSRKLVAGAPPPDLTLSVGHRSVPVVRALRRRSGGRTKSVHIGFPRISPSHFDLVVTTPQYPVPEAQNVVRLAFALAGTLAREPSTDDAKLLASLPSPRHLLIVGGPNIYWDLDEEALLKALKLAIADASRNGASIVVTTSPRTPARLTTAIADSLRGAPVPTLLAQPKRAPSYASLLDAADSIRVTADSVAMVSDAIWTGKPMALIPVRKNRLGAFVMSTMDRLRPGRRVYPQDLRFFWRAIGDLGIGEQPRSPTTSGEEQLRALVARIRNLVR